MRQSDSQRRGLIQSAILFVCFVAGGGLACWLVFQAAAGSVLNSARQELLGIAKLAALQVNLESQQKLIKREDANLPEYASESESLRAVLQQTQGLRFIYTVRQKGSDFEFVVDPTEEGDADSDGVQDKSYLGDVITEVPIELRRTFAAGEPQITPEPFADDWGNFLSAYAPIKDQYGRVQLVVGVDRPFELVAARLDTLRNGILWAFGAWFALSFAIAWFFYHSRIAAGPASGAKIFQSRGARIIAEIALILVAGFVLVDATRAQWTISQLRVQGVETVEDQATLRDAEEALMSLAANPTSQSAAVTLARRLQLSAPELATQLASLRAARKLSAADLSDIHKGLQDRGKEHSQTLLGQMRAEKEEGVRLTRAMVCALILALLAVGLIRAAARTGKQLRTAVLASAKMEKSYKQLLDSAPVGLFTIRGGDIDYSNLHWKKMTGCEEESTRASLVSRVHPADREMVHGALEGAAKQGQGFDLQFRTMADASGLRHLAMRGMPIQDEDGQLSHIFAFLIDVTESVEARLNLQTKGEEVEIKNRMLATALEDLEANLESVVRCLVRAVEAKDPYTAGHSERVMQYSLWIGEELGLGPYEMRVLELGTLVHDVGKIGIPDAILTKPGRLEPEEYEEIKKHPDMGVRILEGIGLFHDCIPIVKWHHERLDGMGYPDRLSGDEVPFLVRIAAVADVFDAMTSTRAYRAGIEPAIVLKVLRDDSERGILDGLVVEALERAIARYGVIPQVDPTIQERKSA